MKYLATILIAFAFAWGCASGDQKEEGSDSLLKKATDAAASEAGQKAIQGAKEKATDPAMQEKVKETLKKKQ